MKPFAEKFYKSSAWINCRTSYIKYRCGECERCGKLGKIVHHTIYLTPKNINDTSITLNFKYLELVCQECHNKEHMKKKIYTRYTFDKYGNVIMTEDN